MMEWIMSNIGPNFKPPGQPLPSAGARPAGEAGQSPAANGPALPTGGNVPLQAPGLAQAALAPLLAFENALTAEQLVLLLRNLLQMPKEMVQLLAMFAEGDPAAGQAILKTLLAEEIPVSLEALQQFVQSNADKAQDKLLKLLQSSQMPLTGSGKQMGELLGNLSDMAGKAGKSPMEALHTAISLYLPGYPLHPPQAFTLRFETPGGGEDEESGAQQEDQLVLWIETIHLGHFKITITTGQPPEAEQSSSRWQVWVEHDPVAALNLPDLRDQVVTAAGGAAMVSLMFLPRSAATPARPPERPQTHPTVEHPAVSGNPAAESASGGRQSVGIHPAGGVSAGILCLAYLLIRVVFELDNREGLTRQRAAAI
jgi:hypothetical protein